MITIDTPEREAMVTIPVNMFVELIARNEQLRIIERMADNNSVCFADEVYTILGKEKSPTTDQSR